MKVVGPTPYRRHLNETRPPSASTRSIEPDQARPPAEVRGRRRPYVARPSTAARRSPAATSTSVGEARCACLATLDAPRRLA